MLESLKRGPELTGASRYHVRAVGLLLLLALLTGCETARSRAEAEAIRTDAHMRAVATQQALDIQATATAIQVDEDLETQPERIRNREAREWWLNVILIGLVLSLAALATGWLAGELKARLTKALNEARSYWPDPQTGALPVVRVDYVPGWTARLVHEAAPLIQLVRPGFVPKPLQYATMLVDLDAGAQLRVCRVIDEQGRLHVWQEAHLAPPGQHALAHHTRRVVALGNAIAGMNQRHMAAGDIAQAVPQVGHMPVFEPNYASDSGDMGHIHLGGNGREP